MWMAAGEGRRGGGEYVDDYYDDDNDDDNDDIDDGEWETRELRYNLPCPQRETPR